MAASIAAVRLVIDGISTLLHELGERTHDYLSALNDVVYSAKVTRLYLLEIAPFNGMRVNSTNSPLAVLGDNVIVEQQYEIAGQLRRILAILCMRLSSFDRTLRELILDVSGIRNAMPDESTLHQLQVGAQLSAGEVSEAVRGAADDTEVNLNLASHIFTDSEDRPWFDPEAVFSDQAPRSI